MTQKLIDLGGKEWQKNSMHRIYFNEYVLKDLIGFEYETYKTGNIKTAKLGGEDISNSRASGLRLELNVGKFWYDVNDQKFHSRDICQHTLDAITKAITEAIA